MSVRVILALCLAVVASASKDCSYVGLGHQGLNLKEVKDVFRSTAEECAAECKKDPNCAGSTHDGQKYCWLHSNVVSDRFKLCDGGCTLFTKSCISEGCVYSNYGHNGNNIGDGFRATAEECKRQCRANGECLGATHDVHGNCWLHSKLEGSRWQSAPGGSFFLKNCNPEVTGCTLATVGHQGNDLPNPLTRTAAQCAADCRAHPGCLGATHDKHGGCYMHSKLEFSRYKTCDGCSLFAKDCSDGREGCVYAKYGHNGNNLGSPFQANPETCKLKCLSDPECEGSTLDEHNWCWLHSKLESSRLQEHDARTLFVKECHGCTKTGFSHAGHDLGGYYATPDLCAAMCRDRPDCFGVTHDPNKICWLHSKIESARVQTRNEEGWTLFTKKC